jgi:LacI family transcriptional regulator
MPVTGREVARAAGVSQPTVSRVFTGDKRITPETRERVLRAARRLGYVPLQTGRSLVVRKTQRVGVVAAEISNPFYPALIAPLHDALGAAGYRTILFTDRDVEAADAEPLIDGSLDGVLLTTTQTTSAVPAVLARRRVPFVQVGREVSGISADACVADNARGATRGAEFLHELGPRRVGGIFGPVTITTARHRESAYRQTIEEGGGDVLPEHTFTGPFADTTGSDGFRSIMSGSDTPTAIFCANDVIAFGALNAASELGIGVPEDVTIVGFDDIPMATWPIFSLTTVRVDLAQIARSACELLVRRMDGERSAPRRVVVPVELVLRATHAPPRTAQH